MKKTMIFVSAVVVMAMGAMFVACDSNTPINGCVCTAKYQGETASNSVTIEQMNNGGYKNCSEVAGYLRGALNEQGFTGASVSCKAY